jgi:hypothetical protein
MIKPEVLDALVLAGCTAQQIAAAVKADQARSSGAGRQARYRARKASQSDERDVTSVTVTDTPSPKKEIPPTPPKEKTTPSLNFPSVLVPAQDEFDQFWSIFPNKVGKRDAARAYISARTRADVETILSGVRRYAAKTDDRPWCNPATFLNQDRWTDDPAAPQQAQPRAGAPPNKPLTQGESLRNMARQKGIIDDAGNPIRRLETSDRDGEDTGAGHVIRLAIAGNHGW